MKKRQLKDALITLVLLTVFFLASLLLQYIIEASELIPAMFVMAVFFVSLITDGYIWGFAAAGISVLAVNFAFTFPFFKFNFTIPENFVSAIIMIVVTFVTSTLTTKIRKAEAARQEAEKEKVRANLLRAVSHDLRTPLTVIYGSASTVLDNYSELNDENKIRMLRGIKEDSEWLIRIVENLLSVTKLDTGAVKLNLSPTVAEELIDSALSKFKKRYPNTTIRVQTPDEFVLVDIDALLIEQVLVNFLENAVQHAKGMTEIIISLTISKKSATFSVCDDGEGIPYDMIENIFTSSHREKDSGKCGMGIGLSVCSTIIKSHGGTVKAENIMPHGAKFSFTLPLSEDGEEDCFE